MILFLYVDDILLERNNFETEKIKNWLSSTFKMKNMSETNYVLGQIKYLLKKLLVLSYENYIHENHDLNAQFKAIDNPT